MAKKSSNPVDAFRKAQRAKELKKNKEGRKKVRDSQAVKKDTRELESEIRQLKSEAKLNANANAHLADLESELSKINKIKEAYVAEHPDAKDRVFHSRERAPRKEAQETEGNELYDETGRLRDPTRSVYFDPVYNPFGAPPPGMPYKERTPVEEDESESEDEDESDDEIILPAGPPPGESDDDSDDEDIPLPPGPPPPKAGAGPPLPGGPIPIPMAGPPITMGFGHPPPFFGARESFPVPDTDFPVPPPSRPTPRPPRQGPPTVQDPLSDAPTQTYQGYRMAKHDLPSRPGPSTPGSISSEPRLTADLPSKPAVGQSSAADAGTISAAPVMRDLRKEATAFVPRGVKRKKQGGMTVNAAPGSGSGVVDEDGDQVRPAIEDGGGLMGKLKGMLEPSSTGPGPIGPAGTAARAGTAATGSADDDYAKFLEGLGDLS